jgi:hypothetical protein
MSQTVQRQLESLCDHFRRRLKLALLRGGGGRAIALAVLLFSVFAVVDWRCHLSSSVRLVMLCVYLAGVFHVVRSVLVAPLRRRWSNEEVLGYLDNVLPDSQGMLLASYELCSASEQIQETETAIGRQLADQSGSLAEVIASQIDLRRALNQRTANRWLSAAMVTGLFLLTATLISPTHVRIGAERVFNPLSNIRWPHRTDILVVQPENGWTVPQLEAFDVHATVSGEIPARVTLAYRSGEDGQWIRERLEVAQQDKNHGVSYRFPEVRDPIEFYLQGGDYTSDRFKIAVVRRPYLQTIAAHYKYPRYAGIPDAVRNSGQVSGIEGTVVTLNMECSMPLTKAVLVFETEPDNGTPERIEIEPTAETQLQHTFMLKTDGRYTVELYDVNDYREARPEVYEIRVTPDEPPEVELLSPGRDLVETRKASVDVAFRASDRLGLKSVQFIYRIGDEPDEYVLSDRFTGPIAQNGNESNARFTWQLRKMDDQLPEEGKLSFFVRVTDNNPTGRGVRQSQVAHMRLVKPSEFHLDAIERARLLEEEARIAWRNQLHAWQLAREWLQKGTGAVDDELWANMKSAQDKSFLAARQIRFHLETLSEKFERNHMSRDFMAGRLSVIAQLLARLTDQEHTVVAAWLERARPKTAAEAEVPRLKTTRMQVLEEGQNDQKMAVLVLERLLRKLYDWRDLQNCTITTKLLYEQQEEVNARTSTLAPKTIAREIEDLDDDDQEQLLTLGKQQRAIFDTETGLERQLTYLTYKAERQNRNSILIPLRAAWANLRNQRVNDYLKRAAELIDNNQPSQILKDQTAAIRALRLVEDGLIIAGQKVDSDEPLSLAMTPSDESQFDPDLIEPEQVAEANPNETPAEVTPLALGGSELATLPEGTDALSAAIRRMIELQDNVLARTRYLSKNNTQAEMPRFVKLKLLRLEQRQDLAVVESRKAIDEATRQENQPVEGLLQAVSTEFAQVRQLLVQAHVDPTTQQLQADAIVTMRELLQYVALEKAVAEVVEENKRLGGVDAFGRQYVVRGQDLDVVTGMLLDINHARQWVGDALRKLQRFTEHPATAEVVIQKEAANRTRADESLTRAAELIDIASAKVGSVSEPTARVIRTSAARALLELPPGTFVGPAAGQNLTGAQHASLKEAQQTLVDTIRSLQDLLEERVRPPVELATREEAPTMTPEEFARLTSRETLAERLKDETSLPPELRDLMLRSLEQDFPEKYRQLLSAYYASFLQSKKEITKEEQP